MKVKHLLATGGVAAILALSGASVASAVEPGPWNDCSDFSTPVKIVSGFDPAHLDRDHDGIGCEDNAGDPMAYDLYSNLKDEGDSNPEPSQLAHTGAWGPTTHPFRWEAASGLLVVGGLVLYGMASSKVKKNERTH